MQSTALDILKHARPEQMTADETSAALHVTDSILSHVCCCDVTKAEGGQPIAFERDMAETLLTKWSGATKAVTRRATQALLERDGELSKSEMQGILDAIAGEIDANFVEPASQPIPKFMTGGYKKAKRSVKSKFSLPVNWSATDDVSVKWLADHHIFWIGNYYDKQVSGALAREIGRGLEQGLGREAIGNQLAAFFNNYPGVPQRPDSYWRGLAANGMNRARNFGLVEAYVEIEVRALEIVAVMDERTSDICREMNGRIIPIGSAVGQRNRMMRAQSPEDVKQIAPWVGASQVRGRNLGDILNLGVILPPYHWHCRSTFVEVVDIKRIRAMQREMEEVVAA